MLGLTTGLLSDWLFTSAVGVYMLAAVLGACEYVLGRHPVFGFVTITFAIVTGAIWAESAWGRYWGWDPKETFAFVSWVCYAAYLHARATSGWQARRAAWLNIVGLVIVLFNLFFVNLVVAGLHSYSGV